jgi:hypothetical protein
MYEISSKISILKNFLIQIHIRSNINEVQKEMEKRTSLKKVKICNKQKKNDAPFKAIEMINELH